MQALWPEIQYGVRMLRKNPGFTLVAVLTLALGIGGNAAVFSLVDKLLLQTLPVADPATLVQAQAQTLNPPLNFNEFSWADFLDYRARNQSFGDLTAFAQSPVNLGEGDQLERMRAEIVSDNYFDLLGVKPIRGRAFLPEENQTPGARPVAVLSYGLWQSRFGGSEQVIGQAITLNGTRYTVVGVAPASFRGLTLEAPADVWVPAMMILQIEQRKPTDEWRTGRDIWLWKVVGRLKPGVSLASAQTELDALALQVRDSWMPVSDRHLPFNEKRIELTPAARGLSSLRGEFGEPLKLLFAVVGVILLIACANLANLLLARATARRKEIAVRLALGAGRLRLMRQLLIESVLLALCGGAAGMLVAPWIADLLISFQAKDSQLTAVLNGGIDWRVAAFAFLLSLVTGLLFGLIPAWQASRPDLLPALKEDGAMRRDRAGFTYSRRALIVVQVALSFVVLVIAGLFLRSLDKLFAIDPGFNSNNVLVAQIELPNNQYDEARVLPFFQQLRERLQTLPGVERVALANRTPLSGSIGLSTVVVEGSQASPHEMPTVDINQVGAGYHELMGIALGAGRGVTEQDRKGRPGVAVINEAFAQKFFPGQNPVGKRLSLGTGMPWLEVVGVTRNVKSFNLMSEDRPQIDLPLEQQSVSHAMRVLVRAKTDAAALLPLVRREVRALDPGLAFFKTTTLAGDLRATLAVWRMAATLTGLFGAVALLLAGLGLYGVIAYAVNQRTREIGIRMALGAQAADVLRLMMREGALLIAAGLLLGLAAAFVATRLVTALLYNVKPTDPLTFVVIAMLLTAVALLACWIPARRAARVDPMVALRCE